MKNFIDHENLQRVLDLLGYAENVPLKVIDLHALSSLKSNDLLNDKELCEEEADQIIEDIVADIEKYSNSLSAESRYPNLYDSTISRRKHSIDELPKIVGEMAAIWESDSNAVLERVGVSEVDRLEKLIWINYPSNPLGIDNLFRFSIEWRWFCLIWVYKNQEQFLSQSSMYAFGLRGWKMHTRLLENDSDRYAIVVGPCYELTDERSVVSFHANHGLPMLEVYSYFHNNYARWGLTKRFTAEEMERILHTRTPISSSAIMERADNIVNVLSELCKFSSINVGEIPLGESFKAMAKKPYLFPRVCRALLLSRRIYRSSEISTLLKSISKSVGLRNSALKISITFPIYDEKDYFEFKLIQKSEGSNIETVKCEVERLIKPSPLGLICSMTVNDYYLDRSTHPQLFELIERKFERWGERINSRRKSLQALRSVMLSDWLSHQHLVNTHVGVVEADQGSVIAQTYYYSFVCRVINEGLRTDICTIYKYEPHLEISGLRVIGKNSLPGRWSSSDIANVELHMEDLANKYKNDANVLSKISIVYESLTLGTSLYLIGEGQAGSITNSSLSSKSVSWPSGVERPGDIMVAPILIQGRVWGVVEVATRAPFSIQPNLRFNLNRYAALLGAFFFNNTLTNGLKELGRIPRSVLPEDNYKSSFNEICQIIAKIFMARSCAIFVSSTSYPREYKTMGVAGPNYFGRSRSNNVFDMNKSEVRDLFIGKLYSAFLDDRKSKILLGKIDPDAEDKYIDDETKYFVLGREYAKNNINGSVIQSLIDDGIQQAMAFVFHPEYDVDNDTIVQSSSEELRAELNRVDQRKYGNPLGIVIVYNQRFQNLPHWTGVTEILSEHLLSCVDEILVDRVREDARGKTIRHEINKTVDSMESVDNALTETLKLVGRFSRSSNRQLYQVLGLRKNRMGEIFERRNWSQLSSVEKESVLDWVSQMPDSLMRLQDVTSDAAVKIKTHLIAIEQLRAQLEAVEKPEIFDIERFLGLTNDGHDQSTKLYDFLEEMLEQYRPQLFKGKGCSLEIYDISEKISLRMSPSVLSYLLRNIFDNWTKYAKNHTLLEIRLKTLYSGKTSKYELSFRNAGENLSPEDVGGDLFEYGTRGSRSSSKNPGAGVGLFWLKKILNIFFDIDVEMKIEPRGSGQTSFYTLIWKMKKHWITSDLPTHEN